MNCTCPHCATAVAFEPPSPPEKGGFVKCPECNGKVWLNLEPFTLRAFKKGWKAFCAECGSESGADNFCQSCYQPYPDYWVVQTNKPIVRSSPKGDSSFLPTFQPKPTIEHGIFSTDSEEAPSAGFNKNRLIIWAIITTVLIVIIAGAVSFQKTRKEAAFVKTYVKMLYGVKTGVDRNLKFLNEIRRTRTPASDSNLSNLTSLQVEIDKLRDQLKPVPNKYRQASENLDAGYQLFLQFKTLTEGVNGNEPNFEERLSEFIEKKNDIEIALKSKTPDDIRKQIDSDVVRYRNLRFMQNK